MKRWFIFCIILLLLTTVVGINQTAVDPELFSGEWYSAEGLDLYLFEGGLIYNLNNSIMLLDDACISGAYVYCKDSIVLFARGIDGLEKERELYLIRKDNVSILCDNENGSGITYFLRYYD